MTIHHDTPIVPMAVAYGVIEEAQRFIETPLDPALALQLVTRAETLYAVNKGWAKTIRGVTGRDQLYVWMRHWLAALLPSTQRTRLPRGFANGEEP